MLEGEVVGKAETVTADRGPTKAAVDKRPTVTLKGRVMLVGLPAPEQLDITIEAYEELSTLSKADVDALSEDDQTKLSARGRRLLRRCRNGAMAVLLDEEDREWILDEMVAGRVTLNDVARLLPEALTVLGRNRGKAPTTGPATRARRRA